MAIAGWRASGHHAVQIRMQAYVCHAFERNHRII
jgi:hypothetical protein